MIFQRSTNHKVVGQIILILTVIMFLSSCTSSIQVLKPQGDSVHLTLENRSQLKAELLSVRDRSIIIGYDNSIYELPLRDIHRVHVEGYSLLHKKVLLLGPLSILDIYILYSNPNTTMKVIFGLLAMGKLASVLAGDLDVVFTKPIFWRDLDKLRLYSRFPDDLNPEAWDQLLQQHGQSEFLKITS